MLMRLVGLLIDSGMRIRSGFGECCGEVFLRAAGVSVAAVVGQPVIGLWHSARIPRR